MAIAFLNGDFIPLEEARISPLDRGFLFADGIYEVIPAYNGRLFRLDEHFERLESSLSAVRLDNPHTRPQWTSLFNELLSRNGGGNLYIYLQITRGAASKRDHAFPVPPVAPTVFAMTGVIVPPASDFPDTTPGVSVITLEDIRWSRCDIKSISLLGNILLRQEAIERGATEAILIRDGFATEGSSSNFFIVRDGIIHTPPKSTFILPGITRDLTVRLCQENGIALQEQQVSATELAEADEIWLSSSTKELVPVTTLDGKMIGNGQPGPVWKQVSALYVAWKRQQCGV